MIHTMRTLTQPLDVPKRPPYRCDKLSYHDARSIGMAVATMMHAANDTNPPPDHEGTMNTTNAPHGYDRASLARIVKHQRAVIARYGHSTYNLRQALTTLRWALAQLAAK